MLINNYSMVVFFSAEISDISSKNQSYTSNGCKNRRSKQYCNKFPLDY